MGEGKFRPHISEIVQPIWIKLDYYIRRLLTRNFIAIRIRLPDDAGGLYSVCRCNVSVFVFIFLSLNLADFGSFVDMLLFPLRG